MSPEILNLPSDLLQNRSLNSNQKLILSLTSTQPKMYSLDIAKSLGTKRSQIQDDLQELVDQGYLSPSNGSGRVAYTLQEGSYVLDQGTEETLDIAKPVPDATSKSGYYTYEVSMFNSNSKELDKSNSNSNELEDRVRVTTLGLDVELAYDYWTDRGGRKHRANSAARVASFELLKQLFSGTAFKFVPDAMIPNPLLNKTKRFDLNDFKTGIDNYIMSLTSPAHYPKSKAASLRYRKKLSLRDFIYAPFAREGTSKSLLLRYLDPPKLINNEVIKFPKLTKCLIKAFKRAGFKRSPTESQITSAANTFGAMIKRHQMKYASIASTAQLFTEFIENKMDLARFEPRWITAEWLHFKFEKWLDRKGLINLTE